MVKIIPLHQVGSDERGATYDFATSRTGQFIVAHRKAGSINGNHYHTGLHPYKRPEILIMMQGKALLEWKNITSGEAGTATLQAPCEVWIKENVWHQITAITDFVMLELNGLESGKGDTFKID
jgi:dTDP-4-dehydrorhamnose 3,5-epimerase-like enzyme